MGYGQVNVGGKKAGDAPNLSYGASSYWYGGTDKTQILTVTIPPKSEQYKHFYISYTGTTSVQQFEFTSGLSGNVQNNKTYDLLDTEITFKYGSGGDHHPSWTVTLQP